MIKRFPQNGGSHFVSPGFGPSKPSFRATSLTDNNRAGCKCLTSLPAARSDRCKCNGCTATEAFFCVPTNGNMIHISILGCFYGVPGVHGRRICLPPSATYSSSTFFQIGNGAWFSPSSVLHADPGGLHLRSHMIQATPHTTIATVTTIPR